MGGLGAGTDRDISLWCLTPVCALKGVSPPLPPPVVMMQHLHVVFLSPEEKQDFYFVKVIKPKQTQTNCHELGVELISIWLRPV